MPRLRTGDCADPNTTVQILRPRSEKPGPGRQSLHEHLPFPRDNLCVRVQRNVAA